jgi:aspartokinase
VDTVAVYLEKPVRTYGIKAQDGLELLRLTCHPDRLAALASSLSRIQPSLGMVGCVALWSRSSLSLAVCLPGQHSSRLAILAREAGSQVENQRAVNLIGLQGPHFGDRWGIAQQALAGLEGAGVQPRLVLGTTHTLQLLVDPGDAPRALEGLRTRFCSPEADHA